LRPKLSPACDPHRRFDIGHKALSRDLLGSLAEGVLVSLWKGIEMSFDRQLQAAVDIHQAACILFLDLTNIQRLAQVTLSDEPGADEDADNDIKYWLTSVG